MRVADHAEHALVLRHTVDGELGVKDFVAAVLAVGLGKHHQFHVGRIAAKQGEGINQVVDLIGRQGQTELDIRLKQSILTTAQHIHMVHRRGLQGVEQLLRLAAIEHGAFGHAVVHQSRHVLQLLVC